MVEKKWPEVYGCYNRIMRVEQVVQQGWSNYMRVPEHDMPELSPPLYTRQPIYEIIPFRMKMECVHVTHHPGDPRCADCHNIPKEDDEQRNRTDPQPRPVAGTLQP